MAGRSAGCDCTWDRGSVKEGATAEDRCPTEGNESIGRLVDYIVSRNLLDVGCGVV